MVGPQALGAVLSQDLDGEARCDQALRGLRQLHVEVLPQATQLEVDGFTAAAAAAAVWVRRACIRGQGSAPPSALVVGYFVRDVNAVVVDLIGRHNLIFWTGEKGRQPGSEVVRGHWVFETATLMAKSTLLIWTY